MHEQAGSTNQLRLQVNGLGQIVQAYYYEDGLKNLEYSGISLNMENSGNSQRIMCYLGEKM